LRVFPRGWQRSVCHGAENQEWRSDDRCGNADNGADGSAASPIAMPVTMTIAVVAGLGIHRCQGQPEQSHKGDKRQSWFAHQGNLLFDGCPGFRGTETAA